MLQYLRRAERNKNYEDIINVRPEKNTDRAFSQLRLICKKMLRTFFDILVTI